MRSKPFFRTLMALLTLGGTPSVGLAYDDAAVAVCLFTKFHGEDPAALGYERVGLRMTRQKVVIELKHSILNTRPKPETLECWFSDVDGYFHILDTPRAKRDICSRLEKLADRESAEASDRIEWEMQKSSCMALYSKPLPPSEAFDKAVIRPLTDLGIYPIPRTETDLILAPE